MKSSPCKKPWKPSFRGTYKHASCPCAHTCRALCCFQLPDSFTFTFLMFI